MKQGSTLVLKGAIVLIGAAVLALCVFGLPAAIKVTGWSGYRPIFLGMYVPAIPFFYALYQSLKILSYIEKNTVFSDLSVTALKNIKYCGLVISVLYALGMPYIIYVADKDDAPGVAALGFVIVFASFVVATAAGVFQKLVQNAVDIKKENDLTV
ncbi:DUF2975 domain-containing protein [Candidatus Parcubacteria bacterium]|nr:MAG: DUF2975 domain-containing protein [Candidatus Parcubacteria bacterium]